MVKYQNPTEFKNIDGPLEEVTGATRTIPYIDSELHEGILFSTFAEFSLSAGSSEVSVFTTTPAGQLYFRQLDITANKGFYSAAIYEGGTYTGGTLVTSVNRNRTSTLVDPTTHLGGVTYNDDGTLIDVLGIPAGTSVSIKDLGLVYKPNTNYFLSVTNTGATASSIFVRLTWADYSLLD